MSSVTDRPHVVAPSVFDALLDPDRTAATIAGSTPQGLLVEVLVELTPAVLGVDGRIDALVAVERHIAMLQARSSELLSALDAGDATEDRFTRDHVAAALRLPPASMKDRMASARDLAHRLPATLELLRGGEISQRHAAALVDATRSLPPESAAAVEAAVLARAPRQTATQFRASVTRAVLRVTTPAIEETAHDDAVAERRVVFIPAEYGMTDLFAYLPADSAAVIKATLDAMAHHTIHQAGGDERTADQRRADALIDLARTALGAERPTFPVRPSTPASPDSTDPTPPTADDSGPVRSETAEPESTEPEWADPLWVGPLLTAGHGQRPAIQVTIAASTLLGLDDQPCELDGHGPITAAMARRIAADPTAFWRRLLTDDHGHVTAAATTTYRPTAEIARTVIARDQHCTFPGCRRASRYNDLDHVIPWNDGDDTTTANLTSLCRRHHRLKHNGQWTIERDDTTGTTTWTDNTGRTYPSRPPDLPTTTTGPETPSGQENPTGPAPPTTSAAPTTSATLAALAALAAARSAQATVGDADAPPPF